MTQEHARGGFKISCEKTTPNHSKGCYINRPPGLPPPPAAATARARARCRAIGDNGGDLIPFFSRHPRVESLTQQVRVPEGRGVAEKRNHLKKELYAKRSYIRQPVPLPSHGTVKSGAEAAAAAAAAALSPEEALSSARTSSQSSRFRFRVWGLGFRVGV